MTTNTSWPPIEDEAKTERLLAEIPRLVGQIYAEGVPEGHEVPVHAGDAANALLFVLATLLESSPSAVTPREMRLLAESAGRELLTLMKQTRRLKEAQANPNATIQ